MPVDLLESPRCLPDHLGLPMPDDRHAVSACLPLWAHNIGYEEGDISVIGKLQAAYPRFCLHPIVQKLCDERLNSHQRCGLPFVSQAAALRAVNYVQHAVNAPARLVELAGQTACGVTVAAEHFPALKEYWQHAGENVSSRVAELILQKETASCTQTTDRIAVRENVGRFQRTAVDNVFLFPSGMAAIAATWRSVQQGWPGATCQFGFPYVDTLKIQQRFPGARYHFLPMGNADDVNRLAELCRSTPPTAVFCEVPTNPLLITPDLRRLRQLADEFNFLLVVDDTLAACGNLNALSSADILITSLTKYFSGYGNVLAGSITLNPTGRHAARLRSLITADFEETLSDVDVSVLRRNCEDLSQRMDVINSNAAGLAAFLSGHEQVESVFYPSGDNPEYESIRAPDGGYGGLLSIVLKKPEQTTPLFFDALEICKGPNLGTHFTLCCPYTLLAHYHELDFAESCGVSRWLLRISVGIEPLQELKRRFSAALDF